MDASKVVEKLGKVRPVPLNGHKSRINTTAWNSSGNYLATGSQDRTLKIWSVESGGYSKEIATLAGHNEAITSCCWNPSKSNQIATCSVDKHVRIWDVAAKKCVKTIPTKGDNINITWSPTGDHIVVGSRADILTLIDARNYKIVLEKKFSYEVNELTFDLSGTFLFTASGIGGVGKVEVFRLKNGALTVQSEMVGHTHHCYCVKLDKTGMYLASGGADSLVNLWDLQDLVCVKTFSRLDYPTRTISMSHDSKIIAYGCEDSVIAFGSMETGAHLGIVDVGGGLNSMAWHPNKYILAYAVDVKDSKEPVMHVIGVDFKPK